MDRPSVELGRADRVALRCASWVFAWTAAVVAAVTAAGAAVWWVLAGRADVEGASRWWPAMALLFVGAAIAVCFWGLSRLCRAVCALAAPSRVRANELQHRGTVRAVASQ